MSGLLETLNRQNYGPKDSLIASLLRHPITGMQKAGNWLNDQMNIGLGVPQYPMDEGSIYATAPLDPARMQAALNIAGLAETGSIPFAPKSAGGLLGTVTRQADNLPETEFSKAHKIAQKNAALPIEQGGLGLPPNNTAMDRAKAMGFDTNAYHGTNQDITKFSPSRHGENTKAASSIAHFYTSNPLEANEYAELAGRTQYADAVKIEKMTAALQKKIERAEKIGDWDNAEKLYLQLEELELGGLNAPIESGQNILPIMIKSDGLAGIDMKGSFDGYDVANAIKAAKKEGSNGLLLSNVFDPVGLEARQGFSDTTQYAMFSPKNIRSKFAAFDPKKRNSANLLASGLLGSLILNDMERNK